MPWPSDDGVSRYFWNDAGFLIDRETGLALQDDNGDPIVWAEPEPDPNESLPYAGPTIWAVTAYRLDLPPETAVTIWIERDLEDEAISLFQSTAGAGMGLLSISRWTPDSLAQHLRWLAGHEGNLAAIIAKT